jgi:benzoyl-CoA reductase/2-hydroxyglutaryl-CoA dehydratase subunit BcrC/BadD/HgdB
MFEKVIDLAMSVSNPYVDDFKGRHKPAIGYVCSYIPRELIHAAGALPYRIRAGGNYQTGLADEYMANITCSFCRSCLHLGLKGEYRFLDGLVSMNTCESMRRMCDNWRHKVSPASFFYYMSVPYKSDAAAVNWFTEELKIFLGRLGEFSGVSVTGEEIRASIRLFDSMRRLLRDLYALRRERTFPFSGAEMQALTAVLGSIPVEDGIELLKEAIALASSEKEKPEPSARVMLVGNCLDDLNYTKFIESFGISVVTDLSCFGMLSLSNDIGSGGDPFETVAASYLRRTVCPRMPQTEAARLALIRKMADDYEVDGIVFERMMYCNLWSGETMWIKRDLKELDIPVLILDRQYTLDGTGQDKTRIEAFLEMIAPRRNP